MMLKKASDGFTLLELVVVVAILAIIASGIIMSLTNTSSDAQQQTTRLSLKQIAAAVDTFYADTIQNPPRESAADLAFLFEKPVASNDWNPDYRQGWRGPYLKQAQALYVDISDDLQLSGQGSPVSSSGDLLNVMAIPDAYAHKPVNGFFVWYQDALTSESLEYNQGRPYLLFGNLQTMSDSSNPARVVSLGSNGQYEPPCDFAESDSDDVNFCSKALLCSSGKTSYAPQRDDLVLCLH